MDGELGWFSFTALIFPTFTSIAFLSVINQGRHCRYRRKRASHITGHRLQIYFTGSVLLLLLLQLAFLCLTFTLTLRFTLLSIKHGVFPRHPDIVLSGFFTGRCREGRRGEERRKPRGEMFNNHKLVAVNAARGVPSSCLRLTGHLVSLSHHLLVNTVTHFRLSSSWAHAAEELRARVCMNACIHVSTFVCRFFFLSIFFLLNYVKFKDTPTNSLKNHRPPLHSI